MTRVIPTVVLALALAAPAAAQEAPAADTKDAAKVVCKTIPIMGSRIGGKRSCRTKQEWQDLKLQTRQQIEKVQQTWSKNG